MSDQITNTNAGDDLASTLNAPVLRRTVLKAAAVAAISTALEPIFVFAREPGRNTLLAPPPGAEVIDELDPGFSRFGPPYWYPSVDPSHFNGKAVYTWNTDTPPAYTNRAAWQTPALPVDGVYTVVVYIPLYISNTRGALYVVTDAVGAHPILIDQAANKGKWVSLGSFQYVAGTVGKVDLDDRVPESGASMTVKIGFDAIAWLPPGVTWDPAQNLVPFNPLWAQLGILKWAMRRGDPVSTALGSFVSRHQDLLVPGPGLSVDFTRTYNSSDPRKGDLGVGWTYTYGMSAVDRGNGDVIVTFADGRTGLYTASGGAFTAPDGFLAELSKSGEEFVLADVDQRTYTFRVADGKLMRIADPNGNTLTFTYTQNNYVLTDAVGREYHVKTKDDTYIEEIRDPMGRTLKFAYDGDMLVSFTDAENGVILYAYNGDMLLTSITDANGHVFVTNHYDGQKRVDSQKDAAGNTATFAYQDSPRITTVVDNEGNASIDEYDDKFRLVKETDALGRSMVYEYDDDNNRTLVRDRENHVTNTEYDERGNVIRIIDPLNQETISNYNARNLVTYHLDPSGAETRYLYDGLDYNLIKVTDAENGVTLMERFGNGLLRTLTNANNFATRFTYDAYANPATVLDPLDGLTRYVYDIVGRRTEMTDANEHTARFEYDNNDRLVATTDPKVRVTRFDFDAVGNLKRTVDRRGNATDYDYDENDSLIKVTDPRGFSSVFGYDRQYHRTSTRNRRGFITAYTYDVVYDLKVITDAKGNQTAFHYDADHLLVSAIDALAGTTQYVYDELHRLIQMTDALDGVTVYTYDPVGRLTKRRDPNLAETQYKYDRLGRATRMTDALTNVTEYSYDGVGNRTALNNGRSFVTTYDFDANNRLSAITDPLSHTSRWTYDNTGNVRSMTDRRGSTTHFVYDANDNLAEVTDALGGITRFEHDEENNRVAAFDANGHRREFTFDEVGNMTGAKLPLGQTTVYDRDENGNIIRVTNAKDNTTALRYDALDLLIRRTSPLGFVTRYDYDELRRARLMTDAENHATEYQFDPLGRMTAVVDALNNVTRYQYDPVGNLLVHTDANGHSTRFDVDLLGRTKKETNPESCVWSYQFDPMGNRTERVDANGAHTGYTFDADDRLTEIRYPDGARVTLDYDENDNLTALRDTSGRATFVYDALNRLSESARTEKILNGKLLKYEYDKVGNRKKVIYPDQQTALYDYNDNDWLESVTDPRSGVATLFTRDDLGLPARIEHPNATWAAYVFDADDRLTGLFNGKKTASSDIISAFDFTLDKVGNRVRTIERQTRGQVVTWTKDYQYDPIYRLRKATQSADLKPYQTLFAEYGFDPVGNRRMQRTNIADKPNTPALPAPVTTLYQYDRANRMLTAGQTVFSYDANGNRIGMAGPERAIDYGFDYENQLSRAVTYDVLKGKRNLDAKLDFAYDGLGRRLERGVTDRGGRKIADFLYDGLGYDLLAEYVDPGSPRTTYYFRDPQQILSRGEIQGDGSGLQYFHHVDGLGSVSAWTNQAGMEVQAYTYAPFGRLIDNNGPDNASSRTDPHNVMTFSGKPWDKETETFHFGARDYDPAMGVWLTQDTYRGRRNEPMTLHRYGYVGNNPISRVDLYGLDGIMAPFAGLESAHVAASSAQLRLKTSVVANGIEGKSFGGGTVNGRESQRWSWSELIGGLGLGALAAWLGNATWTALSTNQLNRLTGARLEMDVLRILSNYPAAKVLGQHMYYKFGDLRRYVDILVQIGESKYGIEVKANSSPYLLRQQMADAAAKELGVYKPYLWKVSPYPGVSRVDVFVDTLRENAQAVGGFVITAASRLAPILMRAPILLMPIPFNKLPHYQIQGEEVQS